MSRVAVAACLLVVPCLAGCVTGRRAPMPPRDAAPPAPSASVPAGTAAARSTPATVPSPTAPSGATLVVAARGIASGTGTVAFALFDTAEGFASDRPLRAEYVPASVGTATWRVEGLAPGRYAVKAYHDRNGNRRLDTGAFGAPVEPYGFSNDARGTFGPPSWGASAFAVGATDASVAFTVR